MKPQLVQFMLSNDPVDWRSVTGYEVMTNAREVIIQAELNETISNRSGYHFIDTGENPTKWFERQGLKVWHYFLFTWPINGDWYGPEGDHLDDIYWLRKQLWIEREKHPLWMRPSRIQDRPYTDMTVPACRDFLVEMMLGSGVTSWYFDEMHVNNWRRQPPEQVEGMLEICQRLKDAGHEMIGNSVWHMTDPHVPVWEYPAIEIFDGALTEYWAGYGDGIPDPIDGSWWSLNEDRFLQVQEDWMNAGKTFYMTARWRPDETEYPDYEPFALDYVKLSESRYGPARYNYHVTNWFPELADSVDDGTDPPPVIPPGPDEVQLPTQTVQFSVVVNGEEHIVNGILSSNQRTKLSVDW